MHMADALLSPAVGAAAWAVSAAALARSASRVRATLDEGRLPLMGVLGAFVFAAQMLNFAIPGTGSSGHVAGTLFLTLLLGPHAAFLTVSSVLVVQALVFADGGLLALGCNILNMGLLPAFVAYPLVVRPLLAGRPGKGRRAFGIILGAVLGLQCGAFAVVLETVISGRTALPFKAFVLAMQPIHLAIGLVEGVATLALVGFLLRMRPELLESGARPARSAWKGALLVAGLALVAGGGLSWFASSRPDGLEWALERLHYQEGAVAEAGVHGRLAQAQAATALMPDYALGAGESRAGTSLAGIGGGVVTLVVVVGVGALLRARTRRTAA